MKLAFGSLVAATAAISVAAFGGVEKMPVQQPVQQQVRQPVQQPVQQGEALQAPTGASQGGDMSGFDIAGITGLIKDNVDRDQALSIIDTVSGNLDDDSVAKGAIDNALAVLSACETCACDNEAPIAPLLGENELVCCGGFLSSTWDSYCDALTFSDCFDTCVSGAMEIRDEYAGDKDVILQELGTSVLTSIQNNDFDISALGGLLTGFGNNRRQRAPVADDGEYCGYLFSDFNNFKQCQPGSECIKRGMTGDKAYGICEPKQGAQGPTTTPTSSGPVSQATKNYAQQIIDAGIKIANFDFDKTACNEHTYKETYYSYEQIADEMSADFVALGPYLNEKGVKLGIVTYNTPYNMFVAGKKTGGEEMIRNVLRIVWPNDQTLANSIPIEDYQPANSQYVGKNPHLQAVQDFYRLQGVDSPNDTTMLADDTTDNITAAQREGYWTIPVLPKNGFKYSNILTPPPSTPATPTTYGAAYTTYGTTTYGTTTYGAPTYGTTTYGTTTYGAPTYTAATYTNTYGSSQTYGSTMYAANTYGNTYGAMYSG